MNYKTGQLIVSPGIYYIFVIIAQISDITYVCYIITDPDNIQGKTRAEYREATKSFLNACTISVY